MKNRKIEELKKLGVKDFKMKTLCLIILSKYNNIKEFCKVNNIKYNRFKALVSRKIKFLVIDVLDISDTLNLRGVDREFLFV